MKIETTQDLLTRLTTLNATAERRFPISAAAVAERTITLRDSIGRGWGLEQLREQAIAMKDWGFMGSLAGWKWLDREWARLVEDFPVPVEEAEIAAHLTASLMEANG